tara:strand:+ start:955 stop:1494 length:540 start_codon:yes stop_codon:yes gene_type:complete
METDMTISNNALSAFNSNMAAAPADTSGGYNSWFPEQGDHDCTIEGVFMTECTGKEWIDGTPSEYDGTLIKFNFRLIDDPGSPDAPRAFDGAPFILPVNGPDALQTEKGQNNLTRTLGRLKGHLTTVLGMDDIPDLGAAIAAVEESIQTEPIAVKVKTSTYNAPNGKSYNTEYISSRLG